MTTCSNCHMVVYDSNEHYYESGSGMGHYRCSHKRARVEKTYEPGKCPSCGKSVNDPLEHYYESGSGMGHYRC